MVSRRLNGDGTATFLLDFSAPWDLKLSLRRIESMSTCYCAYMQWLMMSRAFQAHVLAGDININAFDWPIFCYDESKYDPQNPKQGLLQGHFLLCVYCHIFTGPSSTFEKKTKGQLPCGALNGLSKPTPEMIGYAAIIVRVCSPLYYQSLA